MFDLGGIYLIKDILLIVLAVTTAGLASYGIVAKKKAKKTANDNLLLASEVKNAGEEAIRDARSKTEFVAKMSHEIRMPMTAISSATELLEKEDLSAAQKSYLDIIKHSIGNLFDITNDILDFSKMDAGKLSLIEDEYYLRNVIDDIKSIICPKLDDSQVFFTIDIDPSIPEKMVGDEVRIKQMLINLLSNSVKYTVGGRISLKISFDRLSKDAIDLFITVKDTGCGIAPTEKSKLTKMFEQGISAGTKVTEHGGLGLSICNQLASMMGGHIEMESELGKGSSFTVSIRQHVKDNVCAIADSEISRSYSLDFLVWEDNEYYKQSIYEILTAMGVPVKMVDRMQDLEGILSSVKIDYVITTEKHFNEVVSSINKCSPTTVPVKLVEIGEAADTSFDGNFATLKRPVDVFGVADVIAAKEFRNRHNVEHAGKLMAPDARILLVDDNRVNLKVAKSLLETFEAKVVAVDSGYEALELIKLGEKFDLIFMDHMMPGMDGLEAASKIMDIQGINRTPIIALTANAGGEVEKLFFDAGMSDFIPKPIVMKHLNFVMQKWLPKEKQIYSNSAKNEVITHDARMRAKAFQPDWGLAKVWNDDKLFFEMLHLYMDKHEEYLNTIFESNDFAKRVKAASDLCKIAASAGGARLPDILQDMINVGKSGEENLFNAKLDYLKEENKLLVKDISKYLEKEEIPSFDDILTFE